jgi:hypothetical protein
MNIDGFMGLDALIDKFYSFLTRLQRRSVKIDCRQMQVIDAELGEDGSGSIPFLTQIDHGFYPNIMQFLGIG